MIDALKDRIKMGSDQHVGSSLMCYIEIGYDELVEMIGEPNCENDGYKVDAEWRLEFDGVFHTIYNYKDGKNYCGAEGTDVEFITDWHIGGNDEEKAKEFKEFLLQHRTGPYPLKPVTEEDIECVLHVIRQMDRIEFTKVEDLVSNLSFSVFAQKRKELGLD
jgi:hypothetical protein